MKKLYLFLGMILIATVSFAYTFHITGQVINSINNQPVPNHEVVITPVDSANINLPTVTAVTGPLGCFEAAIEIQGTTTYQYLVYTYGYCNGVSNYYSQTVLCSPATVTVTFEICNSNIVNPQCEAGFTFEINNSSSCAGPGIGYIFSDNSFSNTTIVSWYWQFNNGTVSFEQNPQVCLVPGTYEVCLTILSIDSCEDNYCQNITVVDSTNVNCEAYFSYTVMQPGIIHFTDLSSGNPVAWLWTFGDGTTSTAQNPGHVYNTTGNYTVCLTIETASGCVDEFCMVINAGGGGTNCEAAFSYIVPLPGVVHFTDLSSGNPVAWLWSFGDGTSSTAQNPGHAYTSVGNFTVCLTIETSSNCVDSFCMVINNSGSATCEASFVFSLLPNECSTCVLFHNTSFTSNQAYTSFWHFSDGTVSDAQNPVHEFPAPGTYEVCLGITTANGCTDSTCLTVVVPEQVECQAGFYAEYISTNHYLFHNTSVPENTDFYYHWDFGDNTFSDAAAPGHVFPGPGLYEVCLTIITTDSTCTDVICQTIEVGSAGNFTICGTVYADSQVVESGIVILMGTSGSMYSANLGSSGHYEFHNIPTGTYIMYAVPSFIIYPNYVPTYYVSALYWANATVINLTANLQEADIYLIEYSANNTGTGSIFGTILWNTLLKSANIYKDLTDNSVADISVLLLDVNNDLVNFNASDENGNYGFSNLPFGTYTVYPELAGFTTIPAIITLNENNSSVTDLIIVISGNTITAGIGDDQPNTGIDISIYPNPVMSELNLSIKGTNKNIDVCIFNTTGQVIYQSLNNGGNEKIDVSEWPAGLYCIEARIPGSEPVYIRFVK